MADRDTLLAELDASRGEFQDALADVDLELAIVPGVMGDWSVRDIVVHVAAWCEHGSNAIDLAVGGRGAEFAYPRGDTDAMNDRILASGRVMSPSEALEREDAAFAAFRQRIAALEPSLIGLRLGNGDTVEEVIRYDGPDHYAEHTAQVRAWFGGSGDEDEDA